MKFAAVEVRQDLSTVQLQLSELTIAHTLKMLEFPAQELPALKEPSDSKEAPLIVDVWKSATTISGVQRVMTSGAVSIPG